TLIANLGGHDLPKLIQTLNEADATTNAPSVIFAYTVKGWGLPIAGDPLNHSQLLTNEQMEQLRVALAVPDGEQWDPIPADSDAGRAVAAAAERLRQPP